MDNLIPELSPDIEWMLESGQASKEMLADALVREYLQPVYRFGLAFLGDPQLAELVVMESLSAALMQTYSYHGGSVQAWLFQIVLQVCRKKSSTITPVRVVLEKPVFNDLENKYPESGSAFESFIGLKLLATLKIIGHKNRLAFLLAYLNGWQAELVAETLKTDPNIVSAQLKFVRRKLVEALKAAYYSDEELEPERLDMHIRQIMQRQWPGMEIDAGTLEEIVAAVVAGADQQRSYHARLSLVKEFLSVAVVILLAAGLIFGGNMLFPEPESTELPTPTRLNTEIVQAIPSSQPRPTQTPTPLSPPATLQPLTMQSPSDEIRERIRLSHYAYQTVWIDGLISFYGPEGYAGEPQAYRIQVWIDNTIPAGILLGGVPDSNAEEIGLSRSGVGYWAAIDGPPPYKLQKISDEQSLRTWYSANLLLFQPARIDGSDTYHIIGREELLGRDCLIVDAVNVAGQRVATLWLDTRTGLPLRQRYYQPAREELLYDIRLLDLAIDPEPPADLFNPDYPWTGAFAKNAMNLALGAGRADPNFYLSTKAQAKPLPTATALADFDPGSSQLYFQISQIYYAAEVSGSLRDLYQASIYSDDYFLGKVGFDNPLGLICDRSSDGERLAIAGPGTLGRNRLRWLDLADLVSSDGRVFFDEVTQFAFAPHDHRLAVFASHTPYGSLYILDTDSNQLTHLLDLPDARSIVWSPDGKFLAMIGRVTQPLVGDEVIVVRVDDGQVTYRKSVDYSRGNIGDWPPLEWGIDFPVEMGGLDACTNPPGQ